MPDRLICVGSRCIAARLLVCSVATCVPQQIRNSMGGAVFWCGWHVPDRPLCLGSRSIAARLLVCSVATCVPQQIRNSRGGAVMRTRFADIPLDKGSAISAAPGAGTIAEMVAGIFACFIAGITEGISKTFPQSLLCHTQHPPGGMGCSVGSQLRPIQHPPGCTKAGF